MVLQHFSKVNTPKVVNIRVNAGMIPSDHWIQDPEVGGGRMIGEGCHFVDLASALVASNPTKVMAMGTRKGNGSALLNDNLTIILSFADGSIANITYTADGSKAQEKEFVEMFGGGLSASINDFKDVTLFSGDFDKKVKKLPAQNKGQKEMLDAWIEGLKTGKPAISIDTILLNSLATIQTIESLTLGAALDVNLAILK
ncbi:Gfo/Idh/MocA family oxidoreductase [Psychrosphaera haliotis]|uniref:Gfo/Idh/MocA family protein n=1 Tax=Psychrosphaera haliotis TaxID=555083 RepID=UPI0018C7003A|nr:Gfo/Idh/MocA family oxidoreductase [Psychrosphaera haliotis]